MAIAERTAFLDVMMTNPLLLGPASSRAGLLLVRRPSRGAKLMSVVWQSRHSDHAQSATLNTAGAGKAWVYDDGIAAGRVRFQWQALDSWFEEDEEVFVHPRNPYARCDAIRSGRKVRVEHEGKLLAESQSTVIVFETGLPPRYYFPRTEVNFEHLTPSDTQTSCPYKGRTTAYWSAAGRDVAWSYDFPTAPLLPIAGLVAFFNERIDLTLDDIPQERPVTPFS